jgi:hypothetical protein
MSNINTDYKLPSWIANFESVNERLIRLEEEAKRLQRLTAELTTKLELLTTYYKRGG